MLHALPTIQSLMNNSGRIHALILRPAVITSAVLFSDRPAEKQGVSGDCFSGYEEITDMSIFLTVFEANTLSVSVTCPL